MTRRTLLFAGLLLCTTRALADGGRVRLRQDAGPFAITVFTSPDPLTAGPADVSVMVQEREGGAVLFDAQVEVRLTGPGAAPTRSYTASPGTNRLMKSVAVSLPAAGTWRLEVVVHRAAEAVSVAGTFAVKPAASRLAAIWPYLAAPPAAVVLYVLGNSRRKRPGRRSDRRRPT